MLTREAMRSLTTPLPLHAARVEISANLICELLGFPEGTKLRVDINPWQALGMHDDVVRFVVSGDAVPAGADWVSPTFTRGEDGRPTLTAWNPTTRAI